MTIGEWTKKATDLLQDAKIATARLDALVLLEDATKKDRAWLLAHPEQELESKNANKLEMFLLRRAKHEPLAYIRGKSEFYGREFIVNTHTLEPRPETETMIELLLKRVESKKFQVESIVDVGTGSGCIAITAALELPNTQVYAIDIDEKCLEVAQANAKALRANVTLRQGNLLEPLLTGGWRQEAGDWFILTNLPYVPEDHKINHAATYEPRHAIFGGKDGLDLYRELFTQVHELADSMQPPRMILTESLPSQHDAVSKIAQNHGYTLDRTDDFIQAFRKSD